MEPLCSEYGVQNCLASNDEIRELAQYMQLIGGEHRLET